MLRYIELKTGYADNGPAWVARVQVSKSGRTIYFAGKALKRMVKGGIHGNHVDFATGDEYWVSGVKRNGQDRHWAGSGTIAVEASAVDEYLRVTGRASLDRSRFRVITDLPETAPAAYVTKENTKGVLTIEELMCDERWRRVFGLPCGRKCRRQLRKLGVTTGCSSTKSD